MLSSNILQSFKQMEQKILEISHFHFFIVLQDCSVTSYLIENDGVVHLDQIPDFEIGYLENQLVH